jgi:hypothetical protein
MPRLPATATFSRRFRHASAVLFLGGLAGASGLAGCDTGPSQAGPERTTTGATLSCVGGPKFDPAGEKNVGNGRGGQFIGGQCLSTADCASGCCAFPCGICSGPGAQFQAGKQGCGFGGAKAAPAPAPVLAAPAAADASVGKACVGGPAFDASGEKNVGNGHGVQFIGGQCLGAADCASGCCAFPCGICSGPGAQFQAGKQGCGFGGANAAPPPAPVAAPPPVQAAPPPVTGKACVGGPTFDPAGEKNVGNGHGGQFIGGQCLGAADCASGCCALPCGICSGPGAQFQAGKQGCGFDAKTR